MRVALVPSLVSPMRRAEANGPHAVIVDLARGLAARGHEITLYGAAGSEIEGFAIREIHVEPVAQGAQVGAKASRGATEALNRAFARLFDELRREPPDVISQHAFDAAAIELAEGLPVHHTLHLPPIVPEVVTAARATRAALATVSEAARATWRAAGVRDLAVIRNGVPDVEPHGGSIVPAALIAGRISPEKGTAAAIRVARRAGLAVLVVGDIYDADYFASDVEPLLRPGEWIGPVPRRELAELMARCAVLLMPVRWDEPFGLVAAEAQMAGCPVVAYRRGALPEVVPDRIGGWLVEPDYEEGLVTAVHLARGLDRAAIRSRAVRDLGVRHMVDTYEGALLEIAAHEPRVARAS
jgi:glycosyltransferase involved in cell wall biosynthesis